MKKVLVAALLILGLATGSAYAHGGYGGGYGDGYGCGNWMGGYGHGYPMMGPDMMGYGGYGRGYPMMGPGMMGYGDYGHGYGMMGPGMMGYGGYGHGYGMMGPGMMGYGENYHSRGYGWNAPQGVSSEKEQKFLNDTVQLRKQLNDKRFDYFEARRNPDTTRDQLIAIEKQIQDLQDKISEKAQADR